jgi:hypothetical protein
MDLGLGFDMRRIVFLSIVFTIIPAVLVFLVGCMKPPALNKDFGPEVPVDVVNEALLSAEFEATDSTINNIKVGEFYYSEKTSQIENMFPVVFKQTGETVVAKDDQPNRILFTITRDIRELDELTGNMKPSQSQRTACLAKVEDGCLAALSLPPPTYGTHSGALADLSWRAITSRSEESGIHWTYHNLKKVYSSFPVPALVTMRADCGKRDLSQKRCEDPLATVEVSFDQVDWTTEQYPVKYSYRLVFSPEVPFFASQLMSCGATTIPYAGVRIALMQCESVKDFTFGHD